MSDSFNSTSTAIVKTDLPAMYTINYRREIHVSHSCPLCGAEVAHKQTHEDWHNAIDLLLNASQAHAGNIEAHYGPPPKEQR